MSWRRCRRLAGATGPGGSMGVGETLSNDSTFVDVLALEDFKLTLDARLDEVASLKRTLVEAMGKTPPSLGTLQDAAYVQERYTTLYEQHLDRVGGLVRALEATRD